MPQISICVCAVGRKNLLLVQNLIESHFTIKNGYLGNAYIIYGDTDSVMIRWRIEIKDPTVKEECSKAMILANQLGDEAQDLCNEKLFKDDHPIFLDKEKTYLVGL
jgi:DNA polymerase delta subunit 1